MEKQLAWQPKPLNLTGNLQAWRNRMRQLCPNPTVGQIVYLDYPYSDSAPSQPTLKRVGYKFLGRAADGNPKWQRGQVIEMFSNARG